MTEENHNINNPTTPEIEKQEVKLFPDYKPPLDTTTLNDVIFTVVYMKSSIVSYILFTNEEVQYATMLHFEEKEARHPDDTNTTVTMDTYLIPNNNAAEIKKIDEEKSGSDNEINGEIVECVKQFFIENQDEIIDFLAETIQMWIKEEKEEKDNKN